MSKAYVVAEITVTDPLAYEEYRKLVLPTVLAFGGQFLVRGGTRIQCEGLDDAHHDQMRTVILEFPSLSKDKTIKKSSANTLFTLKKVLGCVIFILKILF